MERTKSLLANIVRIMGVLMRRVRNNPQLAHQAPDAELVSRLLHRGFKPEEIDLAYRWVASLTERNNAPPPADEQTPRTPPFPRLMHDLEACRFSAEAQGEMLQLLSQGMIDLQLVEQVLDFVLRSDLRHVTRTRLHIILRHCGFAGLPTEGVRVSPRLPVPQYLN